MVFDKIQYRGGYRWPDCIPTNSKGEVDWLCPTCGHEHTCQYGLLHCLEGIMGQCECEVLDEARSRLWNRMHQNLLGMEEKI